MKKFMAEFKEFISKGNVLDMAVGVIIGGAFGAIVNALIDNIINPLIAMIGGTDVGLAVVINGQKLNFGAFISAILNFLIIAFIVFLIVKSANKAKDLVSKKEEAEEAATTKTCPFCKSEIAIDATKCPHCTSDIPEEA
ncbi:MAG: large conductance mechanosensitive channel protein MscL [Ruminococcaceae bacterium]|nr:large conductance mechanosensitive channel protein MscL [Oscillospiraceae bacterium]